MKKILILIGILFLISGCGKKESINPSTESGTIENITFNETTKVTNYVKLEMNNDDIILIELYPDIAPLTVENFQKLVSEEFYDGIIFHRVIENFMIQAGDPEGTGQGGSKDTIKGEFRRNGVDNNLLHERGVVSLARLGNDFNSASSQFFIVHQTYPSLDGLYASFGKVIAGLNVVDKIAKVETNSKDKPVTEQKIKTVRFVEINKL